MSSSMTLPREYHHHGFEVVPFDQVPPCDDCLQRARNHGSYGEMCQNLELDSNCGFQIQQQPRYKSPTPIEFCCKHDRPRQNSYNNIVISRQNSIHEMEEVEAVESSV